MQHTCLLYGANGYTGELIARFAQQYGITPILAGRTAAAIEPLAKQLNLPYLVFDLNDTNALHKALHSVQVVIHAAGPFQHTAKQMVEACISTGTHYLDINGDISVFEMIKRYDAAAQKAGIMLMPGVGFDVVPTDCLALLLKQQLPDATHLQLAFATIGGQISHGTATTMASKIGEGGAVRKNGKIVAATLGQKGMWVDFGAKRLFVMSIPWGDISTAHFTTGIPNIETFTGIAPSTYRWLKLQPLFNWLLRTAWMRKYIQQKINQRPAGPTDAQRAAATGFVWGKVTNASGKTATARLTGPEGYTITYHATLLITQKLLNGVFKSGYQTPASVYGADLIVEIPGMSREVLD
jgi:short subunit dehydrogenase-like uncharacterized protein